MLETTPYDCAACGACCQCFPIFASEADSAREPQIKTQSLGVDENLRDPEKRYQLFPLPFHRTCVFLETNKLCRIYETRPTVCRRFEAGSDQCQEARVRIGIDRGNTNELVGPEAIPLQS